MTFPNAVDSVRAILRDVLDLEPTDVVRWAPADLYDRVEAGGLVVHVQPLPATGTESVPWERVDRVQVDAYTLGSTAATEVVDAITPALNGPAMRPDFTLDDVIPDVLPHEAPFMHESVRLVTATYRVVSRPQ